MADSPLGFLEPTSGSAGVLSHSVEMDSSVAGRRPSLSLAVGTVGFKCAEPGQSGQMICTERLPGFSKVRRRRQPEHGTDTDRLLR